MSDCSNSTDYRLPGVSVHVISQARILEWVAPIQNKKMFNKKESSSLEHNKCGIDGWKLVSKACGKEQDKCIISKYLLTKYLLENTHTHTQWLYSGENCRILRPSELSKLTSLTLGQTCIKPLLRRVTEDSFISGIFLPEIYDLIIIMKE